MNEVTLIAHFHLKIGEWNWVDPDKTIIKSIRVY